jgi:hypothetical protein
LPTLFGKGCGGDFEFQHGFKGILYEFKDILIDGLWTRERQRTGSD